MNRNQFTSLLKESFHQWQINNVTMRSAALAFFIILPLPSLSLITIVVLSQFFGHTQAFQQLIKQISAVAGPTVANLLTQLLQSTSAPSTSALASITFVGFSIAGAIGAYQVLRNTMAFIWKIPPPPKKRTLKTKLRRNIRPFLLVSAVAVIIIAWTGITTVISSSVGSAIVPLTGGLTFLFPRILQIVLSFILATILFAIIYREVPDTKIHWGDVKMAAVMIGNGIHLYQRVVFMVCSNIHHHVSSWSRRSTYDSANMDLRNEPVYAVSRRILKNLCFTIRLTKITQT